MMRVVIQSDKDFTPYGKRYVRIVDVRGGTGRSRQLRFYVSGRIFRRLPVTAQNVRMGMDWVNNAGAPDNLPQPWGAFE